ncbi:von Willebrand factor type A domain-containing protein [Nannocystis exedens]|uniref:von Willebrand factor type A domain-containing protein n=1 Tax=Nannocystis exedens TaxID=54 RepID=A0A1I2BB17_9BACT|nr:VWA domain-containing protein [Nannocystis exedens]PCC68093.1 von Willebrand factor [Nannocystis exedens]SFE53078.1 von Willebrand factor type A domain-containing protein [Nannocystis exedens]
MHRTSPVRPVVPHYFVSPQRTRLVRLLPAAVALLGALLPACTPDPTLEEIVSEDGYETNRFLRAIARPDVIDEEPPPEDLANSDDEAAGTGQRHKGEEGKMGRPTSKHKSGLYAMKGPKDAIPQMATGFSGLAGTEIGEAYGVGGLGLVGTGRGGGGTGAGTIGSPYGAAYAVGNDDADVWGGLVGHHSAGGPGGDRYAEVQEAAWSLTHAAPLSTFSIDVDTASYSNVRRFLGDNWLPPADAVRVEEMINYFDYAYPSPAGEHPLGVGAEVAPCPWKKGHQLVRVHLQAKRIETDHVPARNLVFLVDTSGSMSDDDKLGLVKKGLSLLAEQLRPEDRISLVTYAGDTRVALPTTPGSEKQTILRAIDRLGAGGGTNGGAGIVLAYAEAHKHFVKGGINRILLATDGDFNVGLTDHDDLIKLIEKERQTGVFLTVLGVGRGNYNDQTMEQIADHGNGNYAYLDSEKEARKVLVAEASGTLVTVAKDVKLQVEWNPNRVAGYRLLGYENRTLTAEQFNDDKKDAGELGAGDSVTALYEVVPAGRPVPGAAVDSLKYQRPAGPADAELLTIKVRYKQPEGDRSTKFEAPVTEAHADWDEASPQLRLAAAVAAFGLKLRGSPSLEKFDLAAARWWAQSAELPDPEGHRREFVALVDKARQLLSREAVHSRSALP